MSADKQGQSAASAPADAEKAALRDETAYYSDEERERIYEQSKEDRID